MCHIQSSTSEGPWGLIQHEHPYDGDEVEQHQKGDDDQSQSPILLSNLSVTDHIIDSRYIRTLSTAITSNKVGR
jgi:hypothetical protein